MAKALYGNVGVVGKNLTIDNKLPVKISGVYEDIPENSTFYGIEFISPWALYITSENTFLWC